MNNFSALILIIGILLVVAGPIGFIRYKLFLRFIKAQELIAKSMCKLVENQAKSK